MTPLAVLVLAGSRNGDQDPLARAGQVSHKALLPVASRPMLERVLDALTRTEGLGDIWISIEQPERIEPLIERLVASRPANAPGIHVLTAQPSLSDSVRAAVTTIGTPCLVTTADHALLRPSWIQSFLGSKDGDIAIAVASRTHVERDVPETQRTYLRLRDLEFSACNLFWLGSPAVFNAINCWERIQQHRKSPLRMACILGLRCLILACFKRLDSITLLDRLERLTGARIRLISLEDGRAAVDIDSIADLTVVENLIRADPSETNPHSPS